MAKKPSKDALDKLLDGLEAESSDPPVSSDMHKSPDSESPDSELNELLANTAQYGDGDEVVIEQPLISVPADVQQVDRSTIGVTQHVTASKSQAQVDPAIAIMEMLAGIKEEFDLFSSKVIGEWESDRAQIQDVINTFITSVGSNPEASSRSVVEGLVKLLETKVNSGLMAVKLLEVKTKLLTALKSNSSIVINNQNIGGQNQELTELLAAPEASDFD